MWLPLSTELILLRLAKSAGRWKRSLFLFTKIEGEGKAYSIEKYITYSPQ